MRALYYTLAALRNPKLAYAKINEKENLTTLHSTIWMDYK